jgi:hypothetical protein
VCYHKWGIGRKSFSLLLSRRDGWYLFCGIPATSSLAVAVRWKKVKIVELLLNVFAMVAFRVAQAAMVAFRVAQAKEPLLQGSVLSIPYDSTETESALPIRPSEETVFTPAISAVLSHLERKGIPHVPIL